MYRFSVKKMNLEGQMIMDFAKRIEIAVANSYLKKEGRTEGDM